MFILSFLLENASYIHYLQHRDAAGDEGLKRLKVNPNDDDINFAASKRKKNS